MFAHALSLLWVAQGPAITAEKLLATRTIGELAFNSSGDKLAMVVGEPPTSEGRVSNIWVYDLKTGDLKRLTASTKKDTSPKWSPDGKTLAFQSTRGKGNSLYMIPIDGGEASLVKEAGEEVQSFAWAPDGKKIAYLSAPKSDKKSEEDDPKPVDVIDERTGLYMLDLTSRTTKLITPANQIVTSLDWSNPDRILIDTTADPNATSFIEKYYAVDPATGAEELVLEPKTFVDNVRLSAQGHELLYLGCRTATGPAPHDLISQAIGGKAENRSAKQDTQYVAFSEANGNTCVCTQVGFDNRLAWSDGTPLTAGFSGVITTFDLASNGTIAFVGNRMNVPREVFLVKDGVTSKITSFNSEVAALPFVEMRRFKYKSFDGKEIEAGVMVPGGAQKPLPLAAYIHGGPTGAWQDEFDAKAQLLVANGYAVFMPNIRGSTGYGWDFMVCNKLDWGGGDYKDVMAGVDELIKQGIADPNRLCITGWSYGGYMSAWAITQTDRFKASVSGAPMTNIASEFGTEGPAVNLYDQWFNSSLYDSIKEIDRMSPITYAKRVKTPTLLLQGEADDIDPIGQSQEFYRALKLNGVPVEMVLYPGAMHGPTKLKHQLDILKRTIEFLDRYVKGHP